MHDEAEHEQSNPNGVSLTEIEVRQERVWSMWIHLSGLCHYLLPIPGVGVIAPLILWSMKKMDSAYIDENGKEAINFQISILLYVLASCLLILVFIGVVLVPAVLLFQLILCVYAGIRANDGHTTRYPLTIRFLS